MPLTDANSFIQIRLPDIEPLKKSLADIPKAIPGAIRNSIQDALRQGRTALIGRGSARNIGITSRYNIGYNLLLKAIGTPRLSGMTGTLDIAGPRLPLAIFKNNRDIKPFGVAVMELLPSKGLPINMRHAFKTPSGGIYQREGAGAPRYPIRWVMGLSIAEMASEKKEINPEVKRTIEEALSRRMEHYISAYLNGVLVPGTRKKVSTT